MCITYAVFARIELTFDLNLLASRVSHMEINHHITMQHLIHIAYCPPCRFCYAISDTLRLLPSM